MIENGSEDSKVRLGFLKIYLLSKLIITICAVVEYATMFVGSQT